MSQPNSQMASQDMTEHLRNARRSSIRSLGTAKDLFANLPEGLQKNLMRQSGSLGGGRNSRGTMSVGFPSPGVLACIGSAAKQSSIPRPSGNKPPMPTKSGGGGSTAKKGLPPPQPTTRNKQWPRIGPSGGKPVIVKQTLSSQLRVSKGSTTTMSASALSTVRSSSLQSLDSMVSGLETPVNTKNTKTPGSRGSALLSSRRFGSQSNLSSKDHGAVGGKHIKVPGAKDKSIAEMMKYSHNFLTEQGFSPLPTSPLELKNVSGNSYLKMVTMVGQMLICEQFFAKGEPIARIMEMSHLLDYPSAISKSHLQTATAQHAWGCCLTFLAWLCCRVETAYTDYTPKAVNELMKDDWQQIAKDSYLKIFWTVTVNQTEVFPEVVEQELSEFRRTVSEQLMGESDKTREELLEQKQQTVAELEELSSRPRPAKGVLAATADVKKRLDEVSLKTRRTDELSAGYKNIQSLVVKEDSLKFEVQSVRSEVETLSIEIANQKMNRTTVDKLVNEIEAMSPERECLGAVHRNLEHELDSKKRELRELEAKFRQVAVQFTVVELFNEYLSKVKVQGCTVSSNPFNLHDMDGWLQGVAKIHDKIDKSSKAWVQAIQDDQQRLGAQLRHLKEEHEELTMKLGTKKAYQKVGDRRYPNLEKELKDEVASLESQLNEICSVIREKESQVNAIMESYNSKRAELHDLATKANALHQKKTSLEDEIVAKECEAWQVKTVVLERCFDYYDYACKRLNEVKSVIAKEMVGIPGLNEVLSQRKLKDKEQADLSQKLNNLDISSRNYGVGVDDSSAANMSRADTSTSCAPLNATFNVFPEKP